MTTTIINKDKFVEFDLRELDDFRQLRGDETTIAALREAIRGRTILLPGGEDPVPVDPTTPLHNVIAVALSLGMRVGDSELRSVPLPRADTSSSVPSTSTPILPASSGTITRVVLSLDDFLVSQGQSVPTTAAPVRSDATEINYVGTAAPAPASTPAPVSAPAPAGQNFTLVSAPVPPADVQVTRTPISTSGSAPVPSFDFGDDDPFNVLTAALGETEPSLFADMVRQMGLTPRTQR